MANDFTISAKSPKQTLTVSAEIPSTPFAHIFKCRLFEVYPQLTYPQILEGLGRQGDCSDLTAWLNQREEDGVLIRTDGESGELQDSNWSVTSPEAWAAYVEQSGLRPYSEKQKQSVRDRAKTQFIP